MKRTAGALVLLAAVGGCMSMDQGRSQYAGSGTWGSASSGPPSVPGVQGPWGAPVPMVAPYSAAPPGAEAARAMMAQSVPMELLQGGSKGMAASSGIIQAGGPAAVTPTASLSPPGVPFQPIIPVGAHQPAGAVAAVGAITGPSASGCAKRTEVRFVAPDKMKVSWCGTTPQGQPAQGFIAVPGRYNFVQGAIYRLRLSDIPGLPSVDLYPTLEVVPANARTEAFLAHSAVPVALTNEDIEQVQAGNYLVKVIYLPNPQFQDLAAVGPDEIVSTRLPPGADPIAEAYQRGNILLVLRLGNIDLGLTNTPAMDAPNAYPGTHAMTPGMMPPGLLPGMPMQPAIAAQAMTMGPMMPNGMMSVPATQPVYTTPAAGQTLTPAQLAGGLMPRQTEVKTVAPNGATSSAPANGQTTVVISSETVSAPKRHWWWPWSGSDN
jgi:hypothetical protein